VEPFRGAFTRGYAMWKPPHRLAELYRAEGRGVDVAQMTSDDQHSPPELGFLIEPQCCTKKMGFPFGRRCVQQAIALAEKIEATPQNRFGELSNESTICLDSFSRSTALTTRRKKAYATALEIREKTLGRIRGHSDYAGALNYSHLLDLVPQHGSAEGY